jgi:nucleotide-binding universal stress UspA family protein
VPWIRKVVLIGIGIAIVQQISGVNTIMYYGTQILTDAGFSANGALIANIANGVISVLATFVGIYLLGKIDRRPMLMAGQIGTTSALLLIGLFSLALPQGTGRAFVVLALTVTFLAFQQGATSPVTWLMLAEIFPLKLRGFGLGLAGLTLWLTNFVVGLTFPMLVAALNISNTFFVFVVVGVLAILFVKKIVANLRLSPLDPSAVPSDIDTKVDTKVVERRPRMDVADHVVELLDEQEDIALLVIGMKRRSPVGKLVLGSPAQQLLLRADIPVLAVKTANRTGGTT